MSSNSVDKSINTNKKVASATERLSALEAVTRQLTDLLGKKLNTLDMQIESLADVVNALTDLIGVEQVQERVKQRATDQMNTQEAEVQNALKTQQLSYTTEVSDRSIIQYKETLANGQVRHPGKFYKPMWNLPDAAREFLKGKKIGETLKLDNGATLDIIEVYDAVVPEAQVVPVTTPTGSGAPPVEAPAVDESPVVADVPEAEEVAPEAPVDVDVASDATPVDAVTTAAPTDTTETAQ